MVENYKVTHIVAADKPKLEMLVPNYCLDG